MFSKKEITLAYTVTRCPGCGKSSERRFAEGDTIFAESSACESCGVLMTVERIFGRTSDAAGT